VNEFLIFLELLGTMAFATSGALVGLRKNMDVFGVCILGLTTAVGGGVLRDVILGNTPPATFQDPIYAGVAVVSSLVLFLPRLRRLLMWDQKRFDRVMFLMDTIGLSLFTVAGVRVTFACDPEPSLFLVVFLGVVTGVGGGVLRDILAGDTPYIFVKHIYASACLAGALVCGLMWRNAGDVPAMLTGAAVVFLIRALSAHFRWNLPRASGS
jgi:uncharacterized membrane protein YeiH